MLLDCIFLYFILLFNYYIFSNKFKLLLKNYINMEFKLSKEIFFLFLSEGISNSKTLVLINYLIKFLFLKISSKFYGKFKFELIIS